MSAESNGHAAPKVPRYPRLRCPQYVKDVSAGQPVGSVVRDCVSSQSQFVGLQAC